MGSIQFCKKKNFQKPFSDTLEQDNRIESFFFPSKENEQKLINCFNLPKYSILICVYTITNKNILKKLLEVADNNKKISIRIITDDVQTLIPTQKAFLEELQQRKQVIIKIRLDNSAYSLMHNKYAVLDDQILITGSFNWTQKAVNCNKENLVIIKDKETVNMFKNNFELLWQEFSGKDFDPNDDKKDVKDEKKSKEKKVKQNEQKNQKKPLREKKVIQIKKSIKKQQKKKKENVVEDTSDYSPISSLLDDEISDEEYNIE